VAQRIVTPQASISFRRRVAVMRSSLNFAFLHCRRDGGGVDVGLAADQRRQLVSADRDIASAAPWETVATLIFLAASLSGGVR